jgi:hypothetical protein
MADPQSGVHATSEIESPILRVLSVQVDEARVAKAFDSAYRDLGKRVNVRGFRPGKAPRSVLQKLYGPSVAEEAAGPDRAEGREARGERRGRCRRCRARAPAGTPHVARR